MGYSQSFNISLKESVARERIVSYFTSSGYKQQYDIENKLVFIKGKSKFFYSSKIEVEIRYQGDSKFKVTVDHLGDYNTYEDVGIERADILIDPVTREVITNLEISLKENRFVPISIKNPRLKTFLHFLIYSFKVLGISIAGMIVGGILIFVLGTILADHFITNSNTAFMVAIGILFALIFVASFVWKRWKQIQTQKSKIKY